MGPKWTACIKPLCNLLREEEGKSFDWTPDCEDA